MLLMMILFVNMDLFFGGGHFINKNTSVPIELCARCFMEKSPKYFFQCSTHSNAFTTNTSRVSRVTKWFQNYNFWLADANVFAFLYQEWHKEGRVACHLHSNTDLFTAFPITLPSIPSLTPMWHHPLMSSFLFLVHQDEPEIITHQTLSGYRCSLARWLCTFFC